MQFRAAKGPEYAGENGSGKPLAAGMVNECLEVGGPAAPHGLPAHIRADQGEKPLGRGCR